MKLTDHFMIKVHFTVEVLPIKAPMDTQEKIWQDNIINKIKYRLNTLAYWASKIANRMIDEIYESENNQV